MLKNNKKMKTSRTYLKLVIKSVVDDIGAVGVLSPDSFDVDIERFHEAIKRGGHLPPQAQDLRVFIDLLMYEKNLIVAHGKLLDQLLKRISGGVIHFHAGHV